MDQKCLKLYGIYCVTSVIYLYFRITFNNYQVTTTNIIRGIIIPFWHLWYLYSLIIWMLFIPLMDFLIPNKIINLLVCISISLISGMIDAPSVLQRTFTFLPIFYIGHLCRNKEFLQLKCKNRNEHNKINFLMVVFIMLFFFIGFIHDLINTEVFFSYQSYTKGNYAVTDRVVFLINSLLMSGSLILFLKMKSMKCKLPLADYLDFLGKHTMPIFLWHGLAIWTAKIIMHK